MIFVGPCYTELERLKKFTFTAKKKALKESKKDLRSTIKKGAKLGHADLVKVD